jgi:hypothetical protein
MPLVAIGSVHLEQKHHSSKNSHLLLESSRIVKLVMVD